MAYSRVPIKDTAKRKRLSSARFELTEEWRLMRTDIDKGLKPNEALQVSLTEEDKNKYKIKNRRTVARFVKKYLASRKLPYAVKSFHRDDQDFIIVFPVPLAKRPKSAG